VLVCNRLAFLLYDKLGSHKEGVAIYRKAAALLEDGQAPPATDLRDIQATAGLYGTLGSILSASGNDPQEGLVWCKKGLQLLEPRLTKTYRPATLLTSLAGAYHSTAYAQSTLSQHDSALQSYRKGVELIEELAAAHPGVAGYQHDLGALYHNLSVAEQHAGRKEQAFASLKKATEIKERLAVRYPDVPDYQANLVRSLSSLSSSTKDPEQARTLQRRAERIARKLNRLHPGVAQYQRALTASLQVRAELHQRANKLPQAIGAIDEAIKVSERLVKTTDIVIHRIGLTQAYEQKIALALQAGKRELAEETYRKAAALNPADPVFYFRHGNVLMSAGRLDAALQALQKAVALKPEYAEAQCLLGQCFLGLGRFVEGRAALQRGHELGRKRPDWNNPSRSWVRNAERLIQLDERLAAILAGKAEAADNRERLALAWLCQQYKQLNAASVRFYARAFLDNPKVADDLQKQHRYNAACAAALAAVGRGKDAGKLEDKERARLRQQAFDWLRGDLALWTREAEKGTSQARATVQKTLQHWQGDTDLADLRDGAALEKLAEAERAEWKKLWVEVETLRKKCADGKK
jgi:tetratricopeptide (TPR) repeat protein